MPDTPKPSDALTHALTSPAFAEHVVKTHGERAVPDQIGPSNERWANGRIKSQHPRVRAKAIRQNQIKASELPDKPRAADGRRKPLAVSHVSRKPLWDAEQLRAKLQSYDRTPFLDLLAIWMECTPTPQTIMAFADRYPDRFIKAMHDLGRLGGFAEKKDIDINLSAQVRNMSDSQIEDQLRAIAYKMGAQLPSVLDVAAIEVLDPEPAQQSPIPSSEPDPQTSNKASDGAD